MQTNFFDTYQVASPSPPNGQNAPRVFIYDGQYFEDPGADYSITDVMGFLAETYPELRNGSWTSRTLPDGSEEITFVKVTGEKGSTQLALPGGDDLPAPSLDQLPPPSPVGPGMPPRVFIYDGQYFEDPGADYSITDVMGFLAETYPELRNGSWTSRILPSGSEEITFVKVTGEKGAVTTRDIVVRLHKLSSESLLAAQVIGRLDHAEATGGLSGESLLEMAPDIERAMAQAGRMAAAGRKVVRRCLELNPVPHPRVPLGF